MTTEIHRKTPLAVLQETHAYAKKYIDSKSVIHGLTHPDYIGILTPSSIAVGYACALAGLRNAEVVDVTDTPEQKEITNALFLQLFSEGEREETAQEDYEALLQRTGKMALYIIVHTQSNLSSRRITQPFVQKNLFHNFLEILAMRNDTRIIIYGNSGENLPKNITQNLLYIPETSVPLQERFKS